MTKLTANLDRGSYLVVLILILLSVLTFLIRIWPLFFLNKPDLPFIVGVDDPLYELRQVEVVVRNFPHYPWFEPMTYFPNGTVVHWGPVFTLFLAGICNIMQVTQRADIVSLVVLIPPLLAAIIIPMAYVIGKSVDDWKSGIAAAVILLAMPGLYYRISSFDYPDHHIAEVFFGTMFCMFYILTLSHIAKNPINIRNAGSFRVPVVLSVCSAFAYLLGFFTITTVVLFALVTMIVIILKTVMDFYHKRVDLSFIFVNCLIFGILAALATAFGIKSPDLTLVHYSILYPFLYLLAFSLTLLMGVLATGLRGRNFLLYPGVLSLLFLGIIGVGMVVFPSLIQAGFDGLIGVFSQKIYGSTVQELEPADLTTIWNYYHFVIFLMAGGIAFLVLRFYRKCRAADLFLLTWTLVTLFISLQHVHFSYYLAVPLSACTGIFISNALKYKGGICLKILKEEFFSVFHRPPPSAEMKSGKRGKQGGVKEKKTKIKKKAQKNGENVCWVILIVIFLFTGHFIISGLLSAAQYRTAGIGGEWKESLAWIANNTPDPGIDYHAIYDSTGFAYPAEAYGIMSWWDYGHMITYYGKRIPNSNPFQQGAGGPAGAADFFMARDEKSATDVLNAAGSKYVITDGKMATTKFWAIATWYDYLNATSPYQKEMLYPDRDVRGKFYLQTYNTDDFYTTMVSRLQLFDGSMSMPENVIFIEYRDPSTSSLGRLQIVNMSILKWDDAVVILDAYEKSAAPGMNAGIFSSDYSSPAGKFDALQHFRLIHESPDNPDFADTTGNRVKIFEFVRGAGIKGDGVIELDLVTNTGRNFTYRQQSVNGEFSVPYPTSGERYGVKALGKYRILATGQEYGVSEEDVNSGRVIA